MDWQERGCSVLIEVAGHLAFEVGRDLEDSLLGRHTGVQHWSNDDLVQVQTCTCICRS